MTATFLPKLVRMSPNADSRAANAFPKYIVMHYTGMTSAQGACDWLCAPESKVSCHYLVDEQGDIFHMVDEDLRAWHAGVSSWKGETDINSHSVGIEIQNPGHGANYSDFPKVQLMAVTVLALDIMRRHKIDPRNVLAHSDVAPGRKVDPGEKFDWKLLHDYRVGHWVEPAVIRPGIQMSRGDDGEEVEELQQMLRAYGYGIEPNGLYDQHTETVVRAFQLHFRPELVDGVADISTIVTLERLLLT
jgi:N-acetylmuramoyl-L-alanine amidase